MGAQAKAQWQSLRYDDFAPLRELWEAYISDLVKNSGEDLGKVLASADLHGSVLEVVSAKNPGCVRLRGTVIEETQKTLRVITLDNHTKVLPKATCVFEVAYREQRVRLLGPALSHRLPSGAPGPFTPSGWRFQ